MCTSVHIHRVKKKVRQMFLSYLLQNSADSDKSWYMASWINLLQSTANIFSLTWIMSVHYLVKLSRFSWKYLCWNWRNYSLTLLLTGFVFALRHTCTVDTFSRWTVSLSSVGRLHFLFLDGSSLSSQTVAAKLHGGIFAYSDICPWGITVVSD